MSDFPDKSGKTYRLAGLRRLTAGLPDVGTVTALSSGLIRVARTGTRRRLAVGRLQGAVIAYQSG
jgi:hypothetical protein